MGGNRFGKIEDRLLAKMKNKEECLEKSRSQERIPNIKSSAKAIKSDQSVVDRLILYSKIYGDKRKKAMNAKLNFTFHPKINSYSTSVSRSALPSPKAVKKSELNFSFHPEINYNSNLIASKLGTFGNRNTSKTRNNSIEKFPFKPTINKVSSQSDMQTEERWKRLYELNLERREKLDRLKKTFEENDKDFECTFHPKTCEPISFLSASDTAKRLADWEMRRLAKLNQVREKSVEKVDEECTFRPYLYESPVDQSRLIDFYAELERKKKRKYVEIHKNRFTPEKIEWKSVKLRTMVMNNIDSREYDEAIRQLHEEIRIK